jgi:hypothetical protein
MIGHDTLFQVYRHPDITVEVGLGQVDDDGCMMVEKTDAGVQVKLLKFGPAVGAMAKYLKRGFVAAPDVMFFNQRKNEFRLIHPDLDWLGLKWVLAATPPNIEEAVQMVVNVVKTTPSSIIIGEEIDVWFKQQKNNVVHLTTFSDLPVWTLALAEVAYKHGWPLRAPTTTIGVPDAPPSIDPQQWRSWLSNVFKPEVIVQTQNALNWTVEELIISGMGTTQMGDLSAFL